MPFFPNTRTATNRGSLALVCKNRKLWAADFQYDKFFLDMKSNQRSESLKIKSLEAPRHINVIT
jgi:hypothetical protein